MDVIGSIPVGPTKKPVAAGPKPPGGVFCLRAGAGPGVLGWSRGRARKSAHGCLVSKDRTGRIASKDRPGRTEAMRRCSGTRPRRDLGAVVGQYRGRDPEEGRRGRAPSCQPRRARRADRVLRRADRVPRGDRGHLAADHRADLRGAPDPGRDAVRLLQGPQEGRRRAAPIYTAPTVDAAETELLAFADSELGQRTRPRSRPGNAPGSGSSRSWPSRPSSPDHLHHQRDRVAELPAPQDHQEPRALPRRRPPSSCSGWPSATSKTNAPANGPNSKAKPGRTGPRPSANSSKEPRRQDGGSPRRPRAEQHRRRRRHQHRRRDQGALKGTPLLIPKD